ncbi:hypothetical protein VTN00DRAFT_8054 [Thermoascus crustaceus]|uniref:uncharacterized protein n=1 Tax=Thermoascus crustaceus TaxID=5088 RepID=UPI0037430031
MKSTAVLGSLALCFAPAFGVLVANGTVTAHTSGLPSPQLSPITPPAAPPVFPKGTPQEGSFGFNRVHVRQIKPLEQY